MMFYDIHTHHRHLQQADTASIYNFNVGEFISCCGLDLHHTHYSLGIHPWDINIDKLSTAIGFIEQNVVFDCVKAIGECGLDKRCDTPWDVQLRAFVAQVKISEGIKKPLIVHCVKAFDELIALKKELTPLQPWIIHGFRGKSQQAEQLIRQGFFLSFGEKYNEQSLRIVPANRLFLETDNAGTTIEQVYEIIAGSLNCNRARLHSQIEENMNLYFNIHKSAPFTL